MGVGNWKKTFQDLKNLNTIPPHTRAGSPNFKVKSLDFWGVIGRGKIMEGFPSDGLM